MLSSSDHDLGQRLGQLIRQSGVTAFESGVISRRLQAQLQDLLGADTTLLNPLRDLLQRPAFRQLFILSSQGGQIIHARDALLRDLAEVYSPAVLGRLDAVLQSCLNLPGPAATWPTSTASTSNTRPAASAFVLGAPSQMAPMAATPTTVVTIPSSQQGPSTILIALLALICGALVMALTGVLITYRTSSGTTSAPAASNPNGPVTPAAPSITKSSATPLPAPATPTSVTDGLWQACIDDPNADGPPPQAGETWWPVVGPGEALQDSRQHCRSDAFTNAGGNTQIASFRDRATAAAFAEQLTSDQSHPHGFWVGDSSIR